MRYFGVPYAPRKPSAWKRLALLSVGALVLILALRLTSRPAPASASATPALSPGNRAASARPGATSGATAATSVAASSATSTWWRLGALVSNSRAATLLEPAHDEPSYADRHRRIFTLARPASPRPAAGQRLRLPLPDGRIAEGVINLVQPYPAGPVQIGGALDDGGSFALSQLPDGQLLGRILPASTPTLAYVLAEARDGEVYLVEKDRDTVLCVGMTVGDRHLPAADPSVGLISPPPHLPVSAVLNASLPLPSFAEVAPAQPGAAAGILAAADADTPVSAAPVGATVPQSQLNGIIYIDFDGETVTDTSWNKGATFTVADSGLTAAQVTAVVRRVQEDYLPFNIEVTTDVTRYESAIVRKRMRCIVTTSTSWWSGTGGGVAYTNSWNTAGYSYSSTIPCWAISTRLGNNSKSIADAVSHEVGHTLGLSHDGLVGGTDNYYDGNETETPSWAPIMGNSYSCTLAQWSKGEYIKNGVAASNTENDLSIIAGIKNHVGYKDDDVSSISTSALALLGSGQTTVSKSGIIERTADIDAYLFATSGAVSFALATSSYSSLPNLDAQLTIKDFAGNTLAASNPEDSIYPTIATTLPAGVYVLQVTGAGKGTGTTDGYSNYGSLGAYRITGTVAATSAFPPRIGGWLNTSGQVGVAFTYQIQTAGNPTAYTATGLPAGLALNAATGAISGTPQAEGSFAVVLGATNATDTTTRTVWFNLLPATYAAAVDNTRLAFTSGGSTNEAWEIVDDDAQVGRVSLRAGQITNGRTTWLETTTPGAGVLTFWWKVSCEAPIDPATATSDDKTTADFLRYKVGAATELSITGSTEWTQVTRTLTGASTLRWSYEKDSTLSRNSDTAWIDGITFTMAPAITSAASATAVRGRPFSYNVTSGETVDTYTATGLPAGLTLNAATGVLSGTPTTAGIYPIILGTANIAGTRSATLTLTVHTPYAAWAAINGGATAPTADPDSDGRPNLLEYALASDPTVADAVNAPQIEVAGTGTDTHLEIAFTLPADRSDLRYTVEVSSDLLTWQPGHAYGTGAANGVDLPTAELSRATLTDGTQQVRVRDLTPLTSAQRRFIRLKVELSTG